MISLLDLIKTSKNIILSTHKQCDGDGLGSELALYHALIKMHKSPLLIHVDEIPKKYLFLKETSLIQNLQVHSQLPENIDLVLFFDTNDRRLVEPLISIAEARGAQIAFVDHHPPLTNDISPLPSASLIDTRASSTGELVYQLIIDLGIPLDASISRALYTSITFDTQLYRYIRSSPRSHQIAAQLLLFEIQAEEIHEALFAHQTPQKISFLATVLSQIEYYFNNKVAFLKLNHDDLVTHGLEPDESRDIIDMLMNIKDIEIAVLLREEKNQSFKVSLRSKRGFKVLPLAESIGGGGHPHSAGAYSTKKSDELKKILLAEIKKYFTI